LAGESRAIWKRILVLLLIEWVDFRGFLIPLLRGVRGVFFSAINNKHTPCHFVTPLSRGDSKHGKQLSNFIPQGKAEGKMLRGQRL